MADPVLNTADVLIAGVPWPRNKLFAVIAGVTTLLLTGIVTASAAPAVLGGAAVGIMVGLGLKAPIQSRPSSRSGQLSDGIDAPRSGCDLLGELPSPFGQDAFGDRIRTID